MNQITTPPAGRNRPVSLDLIGDIADPSPRPGDEPEEEQNHCEPAAAMAAELLLNLAEVLGRADRESLLFLLRPNDLSMNARARIAGVSPNTIRAQSLRMKAALRRWRDSDQSQGGGDA